MISVRSGLAPIVTMMAATLLQPNPGLAADDCGVPLSQWQLRVHDSEGGLPLDSLHALTQDEAGFLWIGTEDGLTRFDGRSFERIDLSQVLDYAGEYIEALAMDRHGRLLVGTTAAGIVRLQLDAPSGKERLLEGEVRVHALEVSQDTVMAATLGQGLLLLDPDQGDWFEPLDNRAGSTILAISEYQPGHWWVGYAGQGVQRFDGSRFHDLLGLEPLAGAHVSALHQDTEGTLWIGTRSGLFSLENGQLQSIGPAENLPEDVYVRALSEDEAGRLWIGLDGGGAARRCGGRFEWVSGLEGEAQAYVTAIHHDADGNVWLATGGGGLIQLHRGLALPMTARHGLPDHPILPIAQDDAGRMWIGSFGGGLVRLEGDDIRRFGADEGLRSEQVLSLFPDGDSVWVGTRDGLHRIQEDRVVEYWGREEGLPHPTVGSITRGGDSLWLGTVDGLGELRDGRMRSWQVEGGFNAPIGALAFDDNERLWIATDGNGLFWHRDGQIERTPLEAELPSQTVLSMHFSQGGPAWLTTANGLVYWDGQDVYSIGAQRGLPDSVLMSVIEDDRNGLWLSSNRGVFRLDRAQMIAAMLEGGQAPESIHITRSDGMPRSEANGGFQPAVWRDQEGRLWYPTTSGAAIIDPGTVAGLRPPRPPAILGIASADGVIETPGRVELPPLSEWVEFSFSSPDFRQPERLVYEYRLSGYDAGWFSTEDRRAIYRRLPAGTYQFEARARHPGSGWSEITTTTLHVERHILHQPLLWLVTVVSLIAAMFLVVQGVFRRREQLRIRQMEAQKLEAIGLLAGGVAHDFNNILTTIMGGTELVAEGLPPGSPLQRETDRVLDAAERAAGLTRQLLTFARRQPISPRWIDLATVVEGMRDFIQRLLPGGIVVEWHCEPSGECLVDPVQLQQVIINLVINASDALGGQGHIGLLLAPAAGRGEQMACLSVSDNGPGIDPAIGDRIFEPFFTSRKSEGGTGLGLAVSEGIVRQAGGRISHRSKPGGGTIFEVLLPVRFVESNG